MNTAQKGKEKLAKYKGKEILPEMLVPATFLTPGPPLSSGQPQHTLKRKRKKPSTTLDSEVKKEVKDEEVPEAGPVEEGIAQVRKGTEVEARLYHKI